MSDRINIIIVIKEIFKSNIYSFSYKALQLLQSYPSLTCFIISADLIHYVFFINLVLIIILHAGFTAYPQLFLESDDSILKIFIFTFNITVMIFFAFEKWTQSFCGKPLIHKISNKLSLDISDVNLGIYNEGSWLALCLCLLAALSVMLSRIVSFCKHSPRVIPRIETKKILKDGETDNEHSEETSTNGSYNLDAVGLYMIVATLVFILSVRLLLNVDMNETLKKLGKNFKSLVNVQKNIKYCWMLIRSIFISLQCLVHTQHSPG